jgi:tetratricopeptide (TPR) repeat protein
MAAPLPVEDLVAMRNEEPRILYQASREMQRRGLRQDALELATRSSAMPRAPKEVHFLRAELIHSLSGIEAAQEAYRGFLAFNGGPHAMRGWAFLRIGEEKSAAQAFRRALEANPDNRWAKEGLAVAEGNPFTSD